MSKPIIKKLENGLRVVYVPFEGIDSATFELIGRAGALWEKPEELGMAHYIEHLAFDGTKKYPDPEIFRGLIEDIGGSLNAYTDYFEVNYQVKVVKTEMDRAFDFLSQQVIYPLFRSEDIEKQRTIITQEHQMYLDDPVTSFSLNSDKYIFSKGSRLQSPVIGTFETINSMDQDQFRNYFARNYTADNFVLSICGNGVEDEVYKLAQEYFSGMPSGNKNEYLQDHYKDEHVIYTEETDKVKQATISILFPAADAYHQNFYPTKYLERIFGGSFSSRLFSEIRQKRGLAYNVRDSYRAEVPYGIFSLIAQVDPSNVAKVIKLMKTEVEKIVDKGITQEEFERSRKSIASWYVFSNESPRKRVHTQGILVLEDHEDETYETMLQNYMAVKLEDVNQMAKEVFSHHPKFMVLSNKITDEQVLNAWNS